MPGVVGRDRTESGGIGQKAYSRYLRGRSLKGYLYRKWLVYPRIARRLRGTVLDFGCGIGDFLASCSRAVGVDVNPYNVAVCRGRGLDAGTITDGRLPFADGFFAGAVMDNVIEHIPPAAVGQMMPEVLRTLAPGGTLVIGIPGPKGYAADADHKRFYTENDLVSLMEAFGCTPIETLHTPFCWPRMDQYLRQYCRYVFFRVGPAVEQGKNRRKEEYKNTRPEE